MKLFAKTVLSLLTISVLAAGLSACGGKTSPVETKEGETESGTEDAFMTPTAYKEGRFYLKDLDEAGCIKRLGRTQIDGNFLTCDWSGTGIIFNVETEGETMTVGYKSSYPTYFTVYIDGVETSRELINSQGTFRLKLFPGQHEISITKENEIDISQGSYCYLTEIGFKGGFYERPADKDLFIEVIGDSIACGDGSLGVFQEGKLWGKNEHSAYASFAAVVCRRFDADYELISRGGIGILRARDEVGLPMPKIYEYISPYRDTEHKYSFERKPDMIIFELGANDGADFCTEEEYYDALCSFLDRVLELNGRDVPVVWTGKGHYESALKYKEEHPEVKFYAFQFNYGTSGGGGTATSAAGHPNAEEQKEYGEALYRFIEEMYILKTE